MLKRFLLMGACLLSLALAGDLQTLHSVLVENTPQTTPSKPLETPEGTMLAPIQPLRPPPEPLITDISEIGIERTRCLVGCPSYSFTVQRDGHFRYSGEYGVERLGDYTGTVDVGRLNQVLRYIEAIDFMDFRDSYSSPYLDNATVYTMVVANGNTKVVANYANSGPATLWALEQLIDSLLETAQWDEGGGRR